MNRGAPEHEIENTIPAPPPPAPGPGPGRGVGLAAGGPDSESPDHNYEPQVETLTMNDIQARAAVSVTLVGETEPHFGAVWIVSFPVKKTAVK
jgi:hypothetical protein